MAISKKDAYFEEQMEEIYHPELIEDYDEDDIDEEDDYDEY